MRLKEFVYIVRNRRFLEQTLCDLVLACQTRKELHASIKVLEALRDALPADNENARYQSRTVLRNRIQGLAFEDKREAKNES